MQKKVIALLGSLVIAAASGCNNAKSPETVAGDVAAARQKASAEVASAEKSAAKDSNSAEKKLDAQAQDLANANAKGQYDVASAQADGAHNVAIEKCLILAGGAQKACKDQADANYELAKANAKATLAAQQP